MRKSFFRDDERRTIIPRASSSPSLPLLRGSPPRFLVPLEFSRHRRLCDCEIPRDRKTRYRTSGKTLGSRALHFPDGASLPVCRDLSFFFFFCFTTQSREYENRRRVSLSLRSSFPIAIRSRMSIRRTSRNLIFVGSPINARARAPVHPTRFESRRLLNRSTHTGTGFYCRAISADFNGRLIRYIKAASEGQSTTWCRK